MSSVHLEALMRQIRSLPFSDMVALADRVKSELVSRQNEEVDAYLVAHALINAVSLESATKPSDLTMSEEKAFRKVFSRKRTFSIAQKGMVWELDMTTMKGATARGTELRATMGVLLDQIAMIQILTKD